MRETGGMAFPGFESIPGYGSAKPTSDAQGNVAFEKYETGMTLRDWFAGRAMQAILSDSATEFCFKWEHTDGEVRLLGYGQTPIAKPGGDWTITRTPSEAMAKQAYSYADYMLAERKS